MQTLKFILIIAICLLFAGCTLHFKATDLEVDAERQRVQSNTTYDLVEAALLSD